MRRCTSAGSGPFLAWAVASATRSHVIAPLPSNKNPLQRAGGLSGFLAFLLSVPQAVPRAAEGRLEFPAGHVLGSAQVLIEWKGARVVVSGDYKRSADPTCPAFELVPCDLFITEATFALPVFQHGDAREEVAKLLRSHGQFPDRAHVVGAYGLGKSQRVIALLREAGYERPIYLHGALAECCALYESFGVRLGPLKSATGAKREEMKGEIVLAPPSAIADRWSRRLPDPVTAFASGWMRVRARARQQGVELPLVISDHADWGELTETIAETGAEEIWVTHGREDALLHHIQTTGRKGRALALVGREDEDQ